jgi:hypothetical protein
MHTPTIIWQDGIEPTSPLETDERIIAARKGEIGKAMAFGSGDFTIAQLTDNVTQKAINNLAEIYSGQHSAGVMIDPGPLPWQPLSVSGDENNATIIVCTPDPDGWYIQADVPGGKVDRSRAQTEKVLMVKRDGRWMYDGYTNVNDSSDPKSELLGQPCDGSVIPVGLFDPAPKLPGVAPTAPVRPPLFWTDEDQ